MTEAFLRVPDSSHRHVSSRAGPTRYDNIVYVTCEVQYYGMAASTTFKPHSYLTLQCEHRNVITPNFNWLG